MSPNGAASVVMDAAAIERSLVRIAHEINEKNGGKVEDVVLLGIPARGDVLAKRIGAFIERDHKVKPPVGILDITLYRDDVGKNKAVPKKSEIPGSVEGKVVVLVDDVLFTGRSTRAAMDALVDYGRPRAIQLAVLVDRGHRELPIRADYVGKNVPTPTGANVKVQVAETDGVDQVILEGAA